MGLRISNLVDSGLGAVGDVPWGTHFCQFYEGPRDVVETFVPYLGRALARGEGCVWVTDALAVADARDALRAAVPDLDTRLKGGQIEILDSRAYYLREGRFDPDVVFAAFLAKRETLRARGFPAGRLAATAQWLDRPEDFEAMAAYEGRLHRALAGERLLCLCGYAQQGPRGADAVGAACNHAFALARRGGAWRRIEPVGLAEAREDLRRRDEFLAVASHGLTTPVDALRLAAQALQSTRVELSPAQRERALALIERQSHRLLRLARELSDVSRLLAARVELELEAVDLAEVARAALEELREDLARAECPVELRVPALPAVGRWDRGWLERVAASLLSNAAKFGAGKPIRVSVERAPPACRLLVEDRGTGLAPERLPHLFEPFQPAGIHPGLGLGLYLVRAVVEGLGGTVGAENRIGGGSKFTVELPCDPAPPPTTRS